MLVDVWFCHECKNGPMSKVINDYCSDCGRRRCCDCAVLTEEDDFKYTIAGKAVHNWRSTVPRTQTAGSKRLSSPSRTLPHQQQGGLSANIATRDPLRYYDTYNVALSVPYPSYVSEQSKCGSPILAGQTEAYLQAKGGEYGIDSETGRVAIDSEPNISPASLLQPDDNQKNSTFELGCRGVEQNGQKSSKTQPAASQLVLDSSFGPHKSQSNMVFRWLDSLQDGPNHASIAKACEYEWQDQPADGGETSQTFSGPLSFTQGSRCNKSKKKRKASEMDGENDGDSISASVATETPLSKIRRKPKFACHFYKMNQHVYGPCGSNGYGSMSHLMEHLRREHGPKDYYCGACWLSFSNAEALAAHSHDTNGVICRPTGGTPVWELGAIPKTRIGDTGRWFWIWEKLFPRFSRPESPYWEPLNSVEQYRAGLRQLFPARLGQTFPPEVVNEVMNALEMHHDSWLTNPLEPRPYEPIPTPAATHSSNLNDEPSMANTSYGLEDVLQDWMQAPTPNTYGVEPDRLSLWPNNTYLDTLAQQSVDVATDPPVDNNVGEEIFGKDYTDPPDSDELAGNVDFSLLFLQKWPNSDGED